MGLIDTIKRCRTYRKFDSQTQITDHELRKLIEINRFTPSPRNKQALKFVSYNVFEKDDLIFEHLRWAGALPNWQGPTKMQQPVAYILILADNELSPNHKADFLDMAVGIAAQTTMLLAADMGYGGTMIAAFHHKNIHEILKLDSHLQIKLILAIGKPAEKVVVRDMQNDNFAYWRDDNQNHYVPKRTLNEILVKQI